MQKELAEGFDLLHRDWETAKTGAKATKDVWEETVRKAVKTGKDAPPMPVGAESPEEPEAPRILTSDVTPERLGTLLSNNPRGLLNTRDELSGWLLGFDRYNKGGERSFWLEAYGARPYTIDRVKAGGSVHIPRLSISVFGGLQPDRLSSLLLGADDDGLPSRFLWSWPDSLPPSRPTAVASSDFVRRAFTRLAGLNPGQDESGDIPILMRLSDEAAAEFHDWRLDHYARSRGVSGMVLSAWGKMDGLVLRLAMVLELGAWATTIDGTPETTNVSRQTVLRAIVRTPEQ